MATTSSERSQVAMKILGGDAWARFDVWAERAWAAAERAAAVAEDTSHIMNSNDDLDHRVVALFHEMNLAKDFASMVNPIYAISCVGQDRDGSPAAAGDPEITTLIITNGDE